MTPRFISVLTVIQLVIILLGVSITGGFLRFHMVGVPNPPFSQLMRDYGFWLGLLPLGWAVASTISVRSLVRSPTASTLHCVAGFVLLAGLILVFTFAAFVAFSAAFSNGDVEMMPAK